MPEGKIIAWNKHTEEYIDVDNLNINWNKEDIKNLSLNINTNKNDSANVVININGKTISVNAKTRFNQNQWYKHQHRR